MNFKQIKKLAFHKVPIEGITASETTFLNAVMNLYSQYENGCISKEKANRDMKEINRTFSYLIDGCEKFDYINSLIGKNVLVKIKNGMDESETNGIISAVTIRKGGIMFLEIHDLKSNFVFSAKETDIIKFIDNK